MERQTFDGPYVQRLIDGDSATEANFVAYFDSLLTFKLRSRLRSADKVDDVKQETFLRVFRMLRQGRGLENPGSLGAYVNSVCNNILFETYRQDAKNPAELSEDLVSSEQDIFADLVTREDTERVRQIVSELPAKDREILRLLFFEQRDKDAICRDLGVDRSYLRVLLYRAKSKFRNSLAKTAAT